MAVVRFYRTMPLAVNGNLAPVAGWLRFTPTARRVIVGDPDNTVLPIESSVNLENGAASADLAATGTDWVWKIEEFINKKPGDLSSAPGKTYYVAVPTGAGPIDDPDLVRVNPGDYTPIDTTKNVSLAGFDARITTLEAGGGGSTPDATSSVKGKVRLAGDLGGTADSPTVPGLASKVSTTDPRLSDARTPTAHTHTAAQISDSTATGRSVVTAADAAAARTAIGAGTSNLAIGTTAGTAAAGNDSRLSDARTPTAHTHNASDVNAGVLAVARIGSGTPGAGKYVDGGTGAWTTLPAGGSSTLPHPDAGGASLAYPPGSVAAWSAYLTGRLLLYPMLTPANGFSFTSCAVQVTTASGSAGSLLRISLYTLNPTTGTFTKQTELGTVATDSTGVKTITVTASTPSGMVFLGFSSEGATAQLNAANQSNLYPVFYNGSLKPDKAALGTYATVSAGTHPATATAVVNDMNTWPCPRIDFGGVTLL